jgi:hypothetical protein
MSYCFLKHLVVVPRWPCWLALDILFLSTSDGRATWRLPFLKERWEMQVLLAVDAVAGFIPIDCGKSY